MTDLDPPSVLDAPALDPAFLNEKNLNSGAPRWLIALLIFSLLSLAGVTFWAFNQSDKTAQQLNSTNLSLLHSQRLAKSIAQAMIGQENAFAETKESKDILLKHANALKSGNDSLDISPVAEEIQPDVEKLVGLVKKTDQAATVVLSHQKFLTDISGALKNINKYSSDLMESAESISALKLQQNAPTNEVSAAGQLIMLTQRIGKSANEFLTADGLSPESVFLLSKDLNTFKDVASALKDGNVEMRIKESKDPQTLERIDGLLKQYEVTRNQASAILGNLQNMVSARDAQKIVLSDTETIKKASEAIQTQLLAQSGISGLQILLLVLAALLAIGSAVGLAVVQVRSSQERQAEAERQRRQAMQQEQSTKRVNEVNQAAIMRLMNELQNVAEGDLTQEATVTEDITGAIADSVNYTMEELRTLITNVQRSANRVAQTTQEVDNTSTNLLAASTEQLREIRATGQSVLAMAEQITLVSDQAKKSAEVAQKSRMAAETGLAAVQNSMDGMNNIRDQIQETSKRMKRLGESSQEIGEITELISDLTEQTNVLALNAAIQAASAGEAGRGFTVVAEEVQRLAERSADATRQITGLVKTIQTDTQDVVAAMERSTVGVVRGAQLSDSAGAALKEIDAVSKVLTDLINEISNATAQESVSANLVATNIQHIFTVTEQTEEGTRNTAQQIRELAAVGEELKQSIARFKLS